jgi:hypothetical protein
MKKQKNRPSQATQNSMNAPELELAISNAVKSETGCEDFVGVIVQPKTSNSESEPNWEVRGVKFGKADRTIAAEVLSTVVTRLQTELRLNVEAPKKAARTAIAVNVPIESTVARDAG